MLCLDLIVLCAIVLLDQFHLLMVRGRTYTGTPMSVTLHPAVYSFDQLVIRDLFVDKTMLIREFLQSKCSVNVVTRPTKWGKSVNLEMLKRFFEVEVSQLGVQLQILKRKYHKLFEGGEVTLRDNSSKLMKPLQITNDSASMQRMGMVPVVMVKLSTGRGKSYRAVEDKLKREIKNAFSQHAYLKVYLGNESRMLNGTEKEKLRKYFSNKQLTTEELENGLFYLTKILFEHFRRKVIVLIDDKDTPLNHAVTSFGDSGSDTEKLVGLLQNMFKGVINNWYVEKCLVTGILPFTEDVLFQNASSVCVSSVLDEGYSEYFGLSEFEVDELFKRKLTPNITLIDKMKYWYKGFHHGGKMVYNPYDILGFLSNQGILLDYWADSGRVKPLDEFLVTGEAQEDLQKLLEDEGTVKSLCKYDDPNSKEESFHIFFGIFYRLMVHHGYLNAFPMETRNDYLLRIPNQEVRNFFVDYKTQWFCAKHGILTNDLHDFVGCLVTKELDQLRTNLAKVFENFKNVTLKEEKDYHNLMGEVLGRLLNHNYVFYNKHFELGRLYHMIVPRSRFQGQNAFVMEYRVLDNTSNITDRQRALQGLAQHTLQHIDSDVYGPVLTQYEYIDTVVTLAVAFCGTDLELAYKAFKQKI